MSDESGPVISLQEFRDKRNDGREKCWVTFIGFPFDEHGKLKTLRLTVETTESEVETAIEIARERGGIFFEEGSISTWFLPWPCAAVYIRRFRAKSVAARNRERP
jgi:hypothetical protein